MYSLPDEQNKLLKSMGDLDAQERAGILPVRNNLNLLLIAFTWAVGIAATIFNVTGQRNDGIQTILIITLIISACFILAYYNWKIGYYLSTLAFIAGASYLSYLFKFENTPLVVLIDSVAVFVMANQFGRNGFILGFLLFGGKVLALHYMSSQMNNIDELIAQLINIFAIGIIPVLMISISKVSRKAKKAEIRAEILALQNQDLVGSWGSLFDTPNTNAYSQPPQPQVQPAPQQQMPQSQTFNPTPANPSPLSTGS